MWLLTKEKIIYVDSLHEWRKKSVRNFHFLDRVWVLRTISQSERQHPHNSYRREIDYTPQEGIIIGPASSTIYSETKVGEEVEHEGWEYKNEKGEIMQYAGNVKYIYSWYRVLLRDGEYVDAHTVKKSHGEFQEEFDHLQEIEKKKLEVLASQERYKKSLEDMEKLLEKWKTLQNTMVDRLIWATFSTKKKY